MTDRVEYDLKQDKLLAILQRLNSFSPNIEASALISGDGLIMSSALGEGVDPDRFAAVCTSLLALMSHALIEVGRGNLQQAFLEGEQGSLLLMHTNTEAVLALTARSQINMGMVMMEARQVADQVKPVLG